MDKEFVPYELALRLKDLGFNSPCLASYYHAGKKLHIREYINHGEYTILAPLWQQAFDFFEKHLIYSHITTEALGSDEWEFVYEIKYLPKEFQGYKKRAMHFKTIESISFGMGTYGGAWSDKNQCRLELLKNIIEIFEQNK